MRFLLSAASFSLRLTSAARYMERFVSYRAAWNLAQVLSTLFSGGHTIGRRGCEMCAPIFDQPLIAVAGGHVEKVDRDRGDDGSIRTVGVAHGKERIGNSDVRFDKADPIVGERRLRVAVDRLQ